MAEYIERETLRKVMQMATDDPTCPMHIAATVDQYITEAPAADVTPVVHGRWVEYQIPPIICCSNCDWATGIEEKNFQHCPTCGAKMDG